MTTAQALDPLVSLARSCLFQQKYLGVDAGVTFCQTLFTAIALAGDRLTWKRDTRGTPRFARASVVLLTERDGVPGWLDHNLGFPRNCQKSVKNVAASLCRLELSPEEYRLSRDRIKRLGSWVPDRDMMAGRPRKPAQGTDFFFEMPGAPLRPDFRGMDKPVFGRSLLVVLKDGAAFHRLLRLANAEPSLWSAAANEGAGLRVSLHGCIRSGDFRSLARKLNRDSARFGWVIPAVPVAPADPQAPAGYFGIPNTLTRALDCRIGAVGKGWKVEPDEEEILSAMVDEDEARIAILPPALRDHCRMDEPLPWSIAAMLRLLTRRPGEKEQSPLLLPGLVRAVSGWVLHVHLQEIRRIFPYYDGREGDAIDQALIDRLETGPAERRTLVRSFHKIATDDLKSRLEGMSRQDLVRLRDDGRWELVRFAGPDLSAELSALVENAR